MSSKNTRTSYPVNPIIKMIADNKRIIEAINNGKSLSTLKGIKIVSPL